MEVTGYTRPESSNPNKKFDYQDEDHKALWNQIPKDLRMVKNLPCQTAAVDAVVACLNLSS